MKRSAQRSCPFALDRGLRGPWTRFETHHLRYLWRRICSAAHTGTRLEKYAGPDPRGRLPWNFLCRRNLLGCFLWPGSQKIHRVFHLPSTESHIRNLRCQSIEKTSSCWSNSVRNDTLDSAISRDEDFFADFYDSPRYSAWSIGISCEETIRTTNMIFSEIFRWISYSEQAPAKFPRSKNTSTVSFSSPEQRPGRKRMNSWIFRN